jgi:hypothetical protein
MIIASSEYYVHDRPLHGPHPVCLLTAGATAAMFVEHRMQSRSVIRSIDSRGSFCASDQRNVFHDEHTLFGAKRRKPYPLSEQECLSIADCPIMDLRGAALTLWCFRWSFLASPRPVAGARDRQTHRHATARAERKYELRLQLQLLQEVRRKWTRKTDEVGGS